MQIFFKKASIFLKVARSAFQPTISVSQIRSQQFGMSSSLQSRSLVVQRSYPFSTTRQISSEEENNQEGDDQNKTLSDKEVAKDLLEYLTFDLQQIYTNQELKKTPLYKRLFEEGIPWSELITSEPQSRIIHGSFSRGNTKEEHCVFFPNTIFQQIFQICESLMKWEKILITAQQGLGKTYAFALYVYLKRKQANCRVFYIHNCQSFVECPFSGFLQQIKVSFAEELKVQNVKEQFEKLENALHDPTTTDKERIYEIYFFSTELGSYLRKNGIQAYIIIDQVNVFAKEENKMKATIANDMLNMIHGGLEGARNIFVASKTYEEKISENQERPEKELIPPLHLDESLEAYIRFLAADQTLEEETIQSIVDITGCIPLEVRMFFQFLGKNEINDNKAIRNYKTNKIDSLRIALDGFIGLKENHLENMAFALEGLMNNGKYNSHMNRAKINQRFFYVNIFERRIYPLLPLVKEGLSECFLGSRETADEIVNKFSENPTMR